MSWCSWAEQRLAPTDHRVLLCNCTGSPAAASDRSFSAFLPQQRHNTHTHARNVVTCTHAHKMSRRTRRRERMIGRRGQCPEPQQLVLDCFHFTPITRFQLKCHFICYVENEWTYVESRKRVVYSAKLLYLMLHIPCFMGRDMQYGHLCPNYKVSLLVCYMFRDHTLSRWLNLRSENMVSHGIHWIVTSLRQYVRQEI